MSVFFKKLLLAISESREQSSGLHTYLWEPQCALHHKLLAPPSQEFQAPTGAFCDWPAAVWEDLTFHSLVLQMYTVLPPLLKEKNNNQRWQNYGQNNSLWGYTFSCSTKNSENDNLMNLPFLEIFLLYGKEIKLRFSFLLDYANPKSLWIHDHHY